MNDDTLKYPMAEGQEKHVLPISMFRIDGDTVYIAGHGAVNENGDFVGDTLETQMRYTMDAFTKILTEIGIGYSNLRMVRAYVQNPADIPAYNAIYREYFVEPYPARTTIVNCLPPGLLFEIDAIGTKKGD